MNRGQIIVVSVAVPMLIWANAGGPPAHSTAAPGGSPNACTNAGCHVGTPLNGGGGRVELQFPDGTTYVPGERQRIRVVITDSGASIYGFQATARLASNEASAQAGRFTPLANQGVICGNDSVRSGSGNCPASAPLEFIEHSSPSSSNTIEFDWTPPAEASGDIRFYVAGNAANGNGQPTGDRIYTANYTLTPRTAGTPPAITPSNGVTNGASFLAGVVSGAWTTIFGSNLATTTRDWTGAIDQQGNFPTSLDGVSVTIDGKPAYVNFISPTQINVQTPDLAGKIGPVQVTVRNANGESMPVSATAAKELPGLFLFTQTAPKFPAAVRADGVFIGPAGLFPGATTVPAKPGDVVQLFGTGFGPTQIAVPPGRIITREEVSALVDAVQVRIGGISVTPQFAGLTAAGLNQINVAIPDLPNGNHAIEMTINSVSIQPDVVIAVQR